MSDFTDQQELEIINSPEFAKFLEERRSAGSDRIGIDDFLEISGNQAKWEKRFADREKQDNKQQLTLEEIKQYLDALETTTDSANDSALDEYFENLQKDSHDILNSIVKGERVLAENTYNTPEAYETTKKFIEDMVGGYFETSLGGQNNDVKLKEVYDKALAMLEAARTAYENGNQVSKDTVTVNETENSDQKTNKTVQTHTEERDVPNMLMVVMDNREAGANHTVAELMAQLDSINAADHNLDADRLKRMVLAIKQSRAELSNQDVLDSFTSTEFQEIYNDVRNMSAQERNRRLETTGFGNFERKINGEDNTFARDRLLALYMLSEARRGTDSKYSLNNIIQTEADIVIGDFIAKNVYGYDDPVNPTSNGVREPYFTRKVTIEVITGGSENDDNEDIGNIFVKPGDNENDDNEDIGDIFVKPGDNENDDNEDIGDIFVKPGDNENDDNEDIEEIRILSMITDDNQIIFNKLQLDVLEAMDVVSADEADEARKNILQGDFDKLFDLAEQADGLSGDDRRKYDVGIAETILNSEQNTEWVPPSVLADIHDSLKKYISEDKKKDENADVSALQELLDKANTQIDKLSEDMSKKRGYHYSDVTNIADIYNGYSKMFTARKADFGEQPTSDEQTKIAQMDGNMSVLSQLRNEYDERWGITELTPKDDDRISEAYDKAFKQIEKPTLDNETLELLKKVTFLDADGKKENQFTDDGQIIEGSKLDKLIKLTANDVAMKAMSNKQELTAQELNANMQETLLINLHAVNVVEKSYQQNGNEIHIEKDELNPDKNASYVQRFKAALAGGNEIEISDAAYVGWKRYNINSAKGFADRLGEKLEAKNATAVEKIYGRVAGIDGVSGERPREKMSAKEFRKYAAKRLAKDFLMSAGIGAGFTMLTGALRAKAGAVVAMGVGVGVGIGATAAMIWKRKKDAKAKGEKYGWRQFFKDPQALIAVGTTVLASMAVATAPISPKLSGVLGYSAIALGTGGKGIDMFQKSQNDAAGVSKWEGFLWAAADAGLTFGGAMAGKAAGQAAMNAWNNAFPDSHLFREKVGVDVKPGEEITQTETHVERHYDPKVVETYKHACESWVDNDTLMKMHDDAIAKGMTSDEFWVKAHHSMVCNPDGVPAEFGTNRAYVNNTVTGTDFKTVDDLKIIHSDNHNLIGELARQEFNFSLDSQKAASSFLDFQNGTVNVTPEINDALNQFDDIATRTGGVGNVSTTPHINEHGLPQNAGYNTSSGALELDAPAGSEKTYTSYANSSDSIYTDKIVTTTEVIGQKVEFVDRYDTVKGIPALVGLVNAGRKLKDRMGALADRLFKKSKQKSTSEPIPDQISTFVSTQVSEKTSEQTSQTTLNEMLDKEYQIVHGHKPGEKERIRYKQLVQNEWQQESAAPADMGTYMQQRMDKFETMIGTAKEPLAENNRGMSDKYKDDINTARQRMWQLPQGERGTADVTLTGFRQHMAKCLSNDGQLRAEVSGRKIDPKKAPVIEKGDAYTH